MSHSLLHDWSLKRVVFDWQDARVMIELEDSTFTRRVLVAEGVQELRVPRMNEWGPSLNVNEVLESLTPCGSGHRLQIEMQSGDVICVVAERILMPTA